MVSATPATFSFGSLIYTITAKVVDSATGNGSGGFDYVIASDGYPALLTTFPDPARQFLLSD